VTAQQGEQALVIISAGRAALQVRVHAWYLLVGVGTGKL